MFRHTGKLMILVVILLSYGPAVTAQEKAKVLIVYFTWAENTEIIDRERAIREANNHVFSMEKSSSADAVTSASVILPGNTAKMAGWIQQTIGGDLFPIKVKDKYSCYWDECLDRAYKEKARKVRPELSNRVDNISEYDVVFLGFPTWWYTIPMAVASFVESHDLSHKKIIPFVAHGTSGLARTIIDLKSILPSSALVEKEIGIYRSQLNTSQAKIEEWLNSLDI